MYAYLSRTYRTIFCWLLGLLMVLALALPSHAHWADLAVADINIKEKDVELNLTMPTGLIGQFDDDKNLKLSAAELTKHQTALQQLLDRQIKLTVGDKPPVSSSVKSGATPTNSIDLNATPDTHTSLLLQYAWSEPIDRLQMNYQLFLPGVSTARCLVQVRQGDRFENLVLTPDSQTAALIDPPLAQQISSFISLGIEHIWTGYDHILFLVSLLMLGGELGYLLKIVTAFSVSHTFTLFLAVFNIISLPSRFVEIVIALSIAYIAGENLWRKEPKARWQIAFGFGLIHGLGFSSVLQELSLPKTNLITSLASFALGIEIGQFAIVIAVYFLLKYLQRFDWHLTLRRLVSIVIMGMSAIWFWERAFIG
jgi:hypothetical protein